MIKGLIPQEDITFLNVNITNKITSKYVKQKLVELQEEMETSTIIVDDFEISQFLIGQVNKTFFKVWIL